MTDLMKDLRDNVTVGVTLTLWDFKKNCPDSLSKVIFVGKTCCTMSYTYESGVETTYDIVYDSEADNEWLERTYHMLQIWNSPLGEALR